MRDVPADFPTPIAVPSRESPAVVEAVRRWPEAALLGQSVVISLAMIGLLRAVQGNVAASAFGLSLCAVWFGLITATLDGVMEPSWIGDARRDTNRATSAGRLVPMALVCLGQSLLAWVAVKLSVGLNGPAFPEIALLALASWAGLAIGMLIVAIGRRPGPSIAVAAVAILAMGFFGRGSVAPRPISEATPTRWAYEGLLLMEAAAARPAGEHPTADLAEPYFSRASRRHGETACVLALGFMLVGFGGAAVFISWGQRPPASGRSIS